MNIPGILLTILSALLFAISPVLVSWTYGWGNNPLTMVMFRNLFVLPVLLILMKKDHTAIRLPREQFFQLLFIAAMGSCLTPLLLYSSYSYIGVGAGTTLHFFYPIFVALFCRFFYHETLGKAKIRALILALTGTLFFMDFSNLTNLAGVAMALTSGMTYAFYMVLLEKQGLSRLNPFLCSFWLALFAAADLFVVGSFTGSLCFQQPAVSYLTMIIIAMMTSFLAVVLLQKGIEALGSSTASIFCLFEPIGSVICGALFLHEELTISKILGCLIIILAVVLLIMAGRKNKSQDKIQ
ncbi:DMT family transporter [Holdemania massiliensis]|uniref:EamA family transporter n=1 Tax=Holdemania massiliensis TaxID=1468449 RepID=A0A6N7SAK8_9FIRM|nr:DMT family transporter [Holdemania massiliensis]MSA72374.1 EamA family transporter [Holdemania massiliensis]MSA90650.1 EamA family transporter [Holdemania massiliensis]MSB79456.1 EamA family transporter [Holdemania massiliensis]MSC34380.1 EamA family transporter [Holdemania massiliensis]MSC40770.1 EamA family transporter [Holdemania massiliensis]